MKEFITGCLLIFVPYYIGTLMNYSQNIFYLGHDVFDVFLFHVATWCYGMLPISFLIFIFLVILGSKKDSKYPFDVKGIFY